MEIASVKLEKKPVAVLIPYANNARTHDEKQIKQIASSIKEFGFNNPVLIDQDCGIIAGHGRVQAAELLGLKDIPTITLPHLSEAQKKAYILADNRMALNAGWDAELLKLELNDLSKLDFDLGLTGFEDNEIAEFLKEEINPVGDPDSIPEMPIEPVSKQGDIWILGNHRLMCADSTSIDSVDKVMNGDKADLLFTDPPYNQETEGGFKGEIGKSLKKQSSEIEHLCNFEPKDFLQILPTIFNKNQMNAYIFCNKDLIVDYLIAARENKYSYNILIWKKPNAIPLGGSFRPDIEYLITFRKSAIWNSGIKEVSYSKVMEFERVKNKTHPTMKPVELIENQVRISSNSGSIVVDLFGGSGSTLIACDKTGRAARVVEFDPKYVDVIIKRWQEYTGKSAILENTDKTYSELSDGS